MDASELLKRGDRVRLRLHDGRALWVRPPLVMCAYDLEPTMDLQHGVREPLTRVLVRMATGRTPDNKHLLVADLMFDVQGNADVIEAVLRGA